MPTHPTGEFQLKIPIKITYKALEKIAKEKLVGERIETDENGKVSTYAEILDLALASSREPGYDLAIDVKFRTLTTLFHGKEASVLLDAALDFDPGTQEVRVKDYEMELDTENWLMKKSLQGLVNTLFHNQIKEKMRFDFRPLIEEQLQSINTKLEADLEPVEGIGLSGFLRDFRIVEIIQGEQTMLAVVELKGSAIVEVKKLRL